MPADARTDAELVLASRRGDDAAFTSLVRRYIRSATLLAAQLLGDRDEAEDVVQDAFTIVYQRAEVFDAGRPFAPWLFAIVRRLAANRRTRDQRRRRLLRWWVASQSDSGVSAPDKAVQAALDAESAQRALEELSPMQRACFELVVQRGLGYSEVAAMHGITESTVRQHVFRARRVLRQSLEAAYDDEGGT